MSSDGNRLKTRSGKSYAFAKQDMSSGRSHVMNDDVLGLIFNELSVKSLLKVESVCNQFMDCVGSALKRKNALMVRFYDYNCNKEYHVFSDGDISDAICSQTTTEAEEYLRETTYDLTKSVNTFGSILKKCSHIKCLYLGSAWIDEKTIAMIVTHCSQLKRLYLSYIQTKTSAEVLNDALRPLLPQLSHLTLEDNDSVVNNTMQSLPQLSSLVSIKLSTDKSSAIDCLPQSIGRLSLSDTIDISVDTLKKRCPLLEALHLMDYHHDSDQYWDQLFADICAHFALKRLHWEVLYFSANLFFKNVSKLSQLRHLSIHLCNDGLDTNAMQSMPSLKSLSLSGLKCMPKMLSKLNQIFPSVKRLVLTDIVIKCECSDGHEDRFAGSFPDDCEECIYKCLQLWSQLPQLKRITFTDEERMFIIESNDLSLMSELTLIPFSGLRSKHMPQLAALVADCVHNMSPKKYVRLELDSDFKEPLLRRLHDMNVTIPNNLFLKF